MKIPTAVKFNAILGALDKRGASLRESDPEAPNIYADAAAAIREILADREDTLQNLAGLMSQAYERF